MPYINLHACDMRKNITMVDILVQVRFSPEYYASPKASEKLKELQVDLEAIIEKYFPDESYASDRWLSDHAYNIER